MSPATPKVTLTAHLMWRVRLARELPRYLLTAFSVLGLAVCARFVIAPPRPIELRDRARGQSMDRAAEAYAVLFARRYLTWDASEPSTQARGLEAFIGSGVETGAGVQPPSQGEQRVEWAEVVQARESAPGDHVYTVAAQTDDAGLLYLTVGVTRLSEGALSLSGYPAFVGAPSAAPARQPPQLRAVDEPALEVVVRRALRNYLGDSPGELAADLAADARVSLPAIGLTVDQIGRLSWAPGPGSVVVQLQAQDERGARYTLSYEVDVKRAQGRWEISAVQMDPYA